MAYYLLNFFVGSISEDIFMEVDDSNYTELLSTCSSKDCDNLEERISYRKEKKSLELIIAQKQEKK